MFSKIIGSGSFLPENKVTNQDLTKLVDTSSDWIESRSGIKQRFFADKNTTSSDLAYYAAVDAIKNANLNITDIDLIIVATTTPDMIFPGTATILQNKLSKKLICPAFDVQAACSGFIYAFTIADSMIKSGLSKKCLLVGAETYSKILDWKDRTTSVLFGDGAGAFILTGSQSKGTHQTIINSTGSFNDKLNVPGWFYKGNIMGDPHVRMDGKTVFKFAVEHFDLITTKLLKEANLLSKEIDWFIPHQANIRIMNSALKKLDLPKDKMIVTVDKHANTSAASIPLAFDSAMKKGLLKTNDKIIMAAVGAGFTWGGVLTEL